MRISKISSRVELEGVSYFQNVQYNIRIEFWTLTESSWHGKCQNEMMKQKCEGRFLSWVAQLYYVAFYYQDTVPNSRGLLLISLEYRILIHLTLCFGHYTVKYKGN